MNNENLFLPFADVETSKAENARKIIRIAQTLITLFRPFSYVLAILLLTVTHSFGQSNPFPNNGSGFFKLVNWGLAALAFLVGAYGMVQLLIAGYNYNKEGSIAKPLFTAGWSLGAWTLAGGLVWNAVNNDSTPDIPDLDIGR